MSLLIQRSLSVVFFLVLLSGIAVADEHEAAMVETYEQDAWISAKDINTQEAYEAYLADYANGRHAKYAKAAINKIAKAEQLAERGVRKEVDADKVVESPLATSVATEIVKPQSGLVVPVSDAPSVPSEPAETPAATQSQLPVNVTEK
ncbi:MAG: hypothetical protein PXX77_09790 [Gallionella sp.]|nr:hypothetical protein [Gallionella sp.]